ncbi:RlmE family RNA methyltransferase [Desulfovibrio litoralis]|uniref:Ribosomal RNA large subunit methyltransferase E n=1 Tax=Desulfovibrio litoralis DSM 11393 TaxID=1121455 RepID=A0A1M7SQ95_9BACT|nr:RlmE family RNA methyltransferase [Desulfovibrio litoralis]SHN60626.1 23S rRNA Um-2552 2'-O-methyltransferase [Desulfovibrio litoralis DSM 11393]
MKKYRDYYFLQAKKDNYPARSVYKLKEIEDKLKLFKKGMKVLDLGAAPGSWSLCAGELVGFSGKVLGVDLQETHTAFPVNVKFMQGDVFELSPEIEEAIKQLEPFDIIMSDMAPRTIGNKFTDQMRSADLCREALERAKQHLLPEGAFIVKIFMGPEYEAFVKEMRCVFDKVKTVKPKSSRSESKEIFIVGLGFKKELCD